jgi:hypothetical protein
MLSSEIRLYMFLVDGETEAPWRGKYTSFEQLLEQTNLASPQRYTAFRDALSRANGEALGAKEALGVDGIIEAGRMPAPERTEFIGRVTVAMQNQGCPLSPRRIKDISKLVLPRPRASRGPNTDALLKKLKKENEALREENKRLRAENKQLKTQLKAKR